MKTSIAFPIALAVLTVSNSLPAQGTAFTYQGVLKDTNSAASGSYDFMFTLFNTNTTGVASGGPVTNSATAVSLGLFTTAIDFGPGVFPGGSKWLEIAVRTNGGGSFTTLAPRQQISPAPYAITASTAISVSVPPGMVVIPAGPFTMGDNLDSEADAIPPVNVKVSAFYIDVNLVSYSQWEAVYFWATNQGYTFTYAGSGKAANHPVQTVTWYDAVKWCNARSQQAGKTPAYYTNPSLTAVYTNGFVFPFVNWTANGYRLPTEAEWEKAARGGLTGQRFPWGNVINKNLANYQGNTTSYSYDLGPDSYNPAFTNGPAPFTNPVGYFAPNGYGVYDMASNVAQWCWDWWATPYTGGTDPHGPAFGSFRVTRGGVWDYQAYFARCAFRGTFLEPSDADDSVGFRCVRGL